jgi:2-methylisocitrate lyase-like PEP mutase family enzyme
VLVTPTGLPHFTLDRLAHAGASIVIYPNVVIRTLIKAVEETLGHLRGADSLIAVSDRVTSMEHVFEVTGLSLLGSAVSREHHTDGSSHEATC